jgi:hypothetical protein
MKQVYEVNDYSHATSEKHHQNKKLIDLMQYNITLVCKGVSEE